MSPRPMRPNYQNELQYKKELKKHIDRMGKSVEYWLTPSVRNNNLSSINDSEFDSDEEDSVNLTGNLTDRLDWLKKLWTARFNVIAVKIASKFAKNVAKNVDYSVKSSLKNSMSVKFEMTQKMSENVENLVKSNVNMIKSIPEQYFTQVTTIALESVTRGRDMHYLSQQLQDKLGVSKRRADFIARDQNDKATVQLAIVRHQELGITKGKWRHSGGGKHPRPKHVKADGTIFDLEKGLPVGDKGQWVVPGQEINCRCIYIPVIEDFK